MRSDARSYRFAAWTLASDVALPELPASDGPADWQVANAALTLAQRHAEWYQKASAIDGLPWVWLGRRAQADVIRFPGLAWCEFDPGARRIDCTWRRHLGQEEPEHLLINHVLPLAASLSGHLVLHASVVAHADGGAVAFMGPVGAGKSTMVAYLASRGWQLVSDDRLILDRQGMAWPIAPYVRLSPDAAARLGAPRALPPGHHKVRIPVRDAGWGWSAAPRRLEAVVCLHRDAETTRAQSLRGRDAALELFRSVLQLRMDRVEVRARLFERVAEVAAATACIRLHRPAQWSSLADTEAVLAGLARGTSAS